MCALSERFYGGLLYPFSERGGSMALDGRPVFCAGGAGAEGQRCEAHEDGGAGGSDAGSLSAEYAEGGRGARLLCGAHIREAGKALPADRRGAGRDTPHGQGSSGTCLEGAAGEEQGADLGACGALRRRERGGEAEACPGGDA